MHAAIRYVENNPVRVGMVNYAEQYRWSSAKGHLNKGSDSVLVHDCYLEEDIKDWSAYLREKEDKILLESIRKNSMTGRPCGDDGFIGMLEGIVGRRLRALPWGRPKKD